MITEKRTELSIFTPTRSFIKPKSGCITFHVCLHCLFTICNYEILAKSSLPYKSNSRLTYWTFSCNTVSRLIKVQFIYRENWYQKSLVGSVDPQTLPNDALVWINQFWESFMNGKLSSQLFSIWCAQVHPNTDRSCINRASFFVDSGGLRLGSVGLRRRRDTCSVVLSKRDNVNSVLKVKSPERRVRPLKLKFAQPCKILLQLRLPWGLQSPSPLTWPPFGNSCIDSTSRDSPRLARSPYPRCYYAIDRRTFYSVRGLSCV